jgi:uncharacterized protein (TIGR02466 family)
MATGSAAARTLEDAMAAHRHGNLAAAERLYDEVLRNEPDNIRALRLRGILARERGDIGASLELLTRAVELAPDESEPLNELALSLLAAGQLGEAEARLREAREQQPANIKTLANLGAVLQQRGHIREAIECYRDALEQEPDDVQLCCNLAKALSDAGEFEAARKVSDTAQARTHGHPLTLATSGALFIDTEDYAAARSTLKAATSEDFPDDMAHVNLALACSMLDDLPGAERALETALEINPCNARAVADLANCRSASGDNQGALGLCESFLQQFPGERLVVGAYALALGNAGRDTEALNLTDCEKLVQVFDIEPQSAADSLDAFNAALAAAVRNDASLLTNPVSKSTTGGDQTGELTMHASEALNGLANLISNAVSEYAGHFDTKEYAGHPVMAMATDTQTLRAWGTVIRSGGQQTSHMHPLAWLSGVYYPHLPADMDTNDEQAGWLEFNRPPERFHAVGDIPTWRYAPREGRLILFPSWFWHRTLPFESADDRVSIAFDIVPTDALRML